MLPPEHTFGSLHLKGLRQQCVPSLGADLGLQGGVADPDGSVAVFQLHRDAVPRVFPLLEAAQGVTARDLGNAGDLKRARKK